MRKVNVNKDVSEIHFVDIHANAVIIVKRQGKIIGTIFRVIHEDDWMCRTYDHCYESKRNLSDLMQWDKIYDCEFYVLD